MIANSFSARNKIKLNVRCHYNSICGTATCREADYLKKRARKLQLGVMWSNFRVAMCRVAKVIP